MTMPLQKTDIHEVIQSLANDFESIFQLVDANLIADFYTDEAMLLPAGVDFIQGKQKIAAYWQWAFDMGIEQIHLDLVELEQHGDTAIEISKYTLSDAKDHVMDQGKGMVIWKMTNTGWKMHRDIWTSSVN